MTHKQNTNRKMEAVVLPLPEAWDPKEQSDTRVLWKGSSGGWECNPLTESCCPYAYFAMRDFSPVDLTPHEIEVLSALCKKNPEVWEPCMLRVLHAQVSEPPSGRNALPVKRLLAVLCSENEAVIRSLASVSAASARPRAPEATAASPSSTIGTGAAFLKKFNRILWSLDLGLLPYACCMLCNMDSTTLGCLATYLRCQIPSVNAELRTSSKRMYASGATEKDVMVESILKGSFPIDFIVSEALVRLDYGVGGGELRLNAQLRGIRTKAGEHGWEPLCSRKAFASILAHAILRCDDENSDVITRLATALTDTDRETMARIARVVVSGSECRREALNLSRASALWQAMVELSVPEIAPSRYDAAKSMTARKIFSSQKIATQMQTIDAVFGLSVARVEIAAAVTAVLEVQIKKLKIRTAALRGTRFGALTEEEEEAREMSRLLAERIARASSSSAKDRDLVDDDALSVFSGDTEVASDVE